MAKDQINAFLGPGTSYQGKLQFQGSVRIDGQFEGEVQTEGTLVVGKEARLTGQLAVGQLFLSGHFKGDVLAREKVVLHKQANFSGRLRSPALMVEEGATLEGEISMGDAPYSLKNEKEKIEQKSRQEQGEEKSAKPTGTTPL